MQTPQEIEGMTIDTPKGFNPLQLKVKQLEEMGFIDRQRNISLLLKYDGNIAQILQELTIVNENKQ